ncbi:substrate-binding domain-containing protein [Vibrio sp. MEBiC08052]|uniref:substrate-binding domain-containing protein n=1 Tax=Vibrio sp. MEBiC08052 TaxID=1761910 RepID=UPI001E2E29BF|nr:substrate-binding domain-containing protein [Vibrio sp. MEBiC08052]
MMNIKDIAALANVSPATISRYFNGTGLICHQTRERIGKIVHLTGYHPKQKSTRVALNHNPTIGVLIPSLLNPVFAEIVAGIQERARHFGYSTIIIDTEYQQAREQQAVVDFIRQRVSGVILTVASMQNNQALSLLKEFNFPLSLVHNQFTADDATVYVNNFQAGWDVADHLLKLGHRELGMVAGQFNRSDRAQLRYEGFKARIAEDQQARLLTLLEVDPMANAPFTDLKQSFSHQAPSAWFCSNDLIALKLIRHLRHAGIRVPEQTSVVGFDGMSLGQITYPALATVKVPHLQMGHLAVDLLLNSKHHTVLPRQRELPYELSLTGTVAPVHKPHLNQIQSIG